MLEIKYKKIVRFQKINVYEGRLRAKLKYTKEDKEVIMTSFSFKKLFMNSK